MLTSCGLQRCLHQAATVDGVLELQQARFWCLSTPSLQDVRYLVYVRLQPPLVLMFKFINNYIESRSLNWKFDRVENYLSNRRCYFHYILALSYVFLLTLSLDGSPLKNCLWKDSMTCINVGR